MTTATATYTHPLTGYTYSADEITAWADGTPPVHTCGLRHDVGAIECTDPDLTTALAALADACRALGLDPERHAGPAASSLTAPAAPYGVRRVPGTGEWQVLCVHGTEVAPRLPEHLTSAQALAQVFGG